MIRRHFLRLIPVLASVPLLGRLLPSAPIDPPSVVPTNIAHDADSNDWDFGNSGDFTFEGWIRCDGVDASTTFTDSDAFCEPTEPFPFS